MNEEFIKLVKEGLKEIDEGTCIPFSEVRKIIDEWKNLDTSSPALPGHLMSLEQFREYIMSAEQADTISLDEFKERWEEKKVAFNPISLSTKNFKFDRNEVNDR